LQSNKKPRHIVCRHVEKQVRCEILTKNSKIHWELDFKSNSTNTCPRQNS